MWIVFKAFDDNTAVLLDLRTFNQTLKSEAELIEIGSKYDVLGLSVSDRKINYINSYEFVAFESEESLREYNKENGNTFSNKKNIEDKWFAFRKTNYKIHVDYYVCCWAGEEATYVCEKGYSIYKQAAKRFNKAEANKVAALMRKNSKTKKYWTTVREEVYG